MRSVLLLDDDQAFAYALSRDLERDGFRVRAVTDPYAALNTIDTDRNIGVLVLDIVMPKGQPHGVAIGRMARMRNSSIKTIYVTGYADLADLRKEAATIFGKPVDLPALEAELRSLLSG
jgi:CheY-like chemotaxis protein